MTPTVVGAALSVTGLTTVLLVSALLAIATAGVVGAAKSHVEPSAAPTAAPGPSAPERA